MPLAQYLVPQLFRKAQDLEDALGPPGGEAMPKGYLEAGYEKTPYDPNGSVDKPSTRQYDPNSQLGRVLVPLGRMQKADDPRYQAFAEGMNKGLSSQLAPGASAAQPLPTSPAAPTRFLRGPARNPRVIPAQTGAVGTNERGESVDARGKSLGYLGEPALVTPTGETSLRNPKRGVKDVGAMENDKFSTDALRQRYGEHLKAMQDNRDDKGEPTDQFPDGYFKGMSKDQKAGIIKGVKELQRREREQDTSPNGGISA